MAARVSRIPVAVDRSTTGTTTEAAPETACTRRQAPQAPAPRKLVVSTPAARVGTAGPAMLQAVLPVALGVKIRAGTLLAFHGATQAPASGSEAASLVASAEPASGVLASVGGASAGVWSMLPSDVPASMAP